ncbi:IgGFc-binding protein-like isoform X5 [Anas acuta]|uniref:IgGFc-binding protein-like isoform X5 n=1 Tax=Anas acuta TaxID=28680 RepID=UPI0035C8BDE0
MGTLWHLQCTLILFCLSVLNTTGLRQRPTGGLRTWDPETAYLTRCDFNNNSRPFCDWTQPCNVNQGVWIRTKHDTPTDGTGPDGDYPDGKGYFIYQEASNLIPFDTNRLESPDVVVSGEICIDFWYYMFGSEELNELRVIIQDSTGESVAWSRKGNQSSSWNYGAVTHTFSTQRRIKVIFEAVRGLTEYGDTALDNVRVRDGSCDAVSTPVPPTPTPTEPTPSPLTEAICSIHGDPHYYTFDKQRHDFMGTCTYTLSKLCESNSSLPYFNVEAANEHRGSNTRVSYVQYVDVDVYGYRINLGKNRVVKVDGVIQVLPLTLVHPVSVSLSGQYVVVTTDFGLNVKFDGDHRAEITLPSTYMSKVCGICGNYNGNKTDDFLNPDGEMETNSASLGNSWQVYNDSRCLPDDGHTPNCTDDEKHIIQSNDYCGLVTDPSGPFQNCHSVVDPQSYFDACQYDLCEFHLNDAALCQNLQAYADVCQAAGVQLQPWRNATFCPLACPANSHYEPCAAACPATCVDPLAPYKCSLPCMEGCVCDSGYLLYNDRCVPSQQCGCWHNGQHYPVGSEFWTDNSCSTKCTCPTRGGKVQCSSASCPAGQYCGVQNGKPECLEHTYGICNVHGDPHYVTFDKVTHDFMGNCTYTLAKVCSNSSVPYFNVEAKNEHRGNPRVSYVREVLVEVYGERIAIVKQERSQVLVNGVRRTLPVSAAGGAIRVSTSGRYIVLETDFNLRVSYDADHSVEVRVPTTYSNLTCGMCGNFNSRREDDYMMPDGQQATDSNALGESWKVPDGDPSCGVPPPLEPCSAEEEKLYQSEQFCGILTASPGFFESCHAVINPQSYFDTCSYDLCALSGSQEVLCGALEAYADACQAAGVTLLPWRNATFCPVACPPNSHYNPCTSACPATCTDPLASKNCSKPCVEGCECNNGFVISGGQCVSMNNCGCLLNDKYYEKGEVFWQTDCAGQCVCTGSGTIVCDSNTCKASEVCKVQNGLLGCYPLNPSTCHIFGDPHYVTFDGRLYHFQGDCNYTVVETCTNSSEQFSVTTRNKHRGNPNWTALDSVAVTLKNLHIVVRRNKETYVDGFQVSLPVDLKHGATVAVKGHYVVIDTSLGIQVKFDGDQELFIQVDESLKGQLCGLCGTFNDNQLDDFLKPDNVLEQDPNKFGDSWLVKDDNWICNPVAVVPPTCDTEKEKEYEEVCKIILENSGPFAVCHWYIPPQLYFESCVYDLCATEGNSEQFCKILEAYAAACELGGVNLGEWREGTICAAPTACNISCTFDVDFCGWEQAVDDNFDWIRNKGPTPSPNTGPSYDHTTGDGYYIYLQGSEHNRADVARLASPICGSEGPHCFRFWYHMYGVAETMALRVYVTHNETSTLEWKEAGNKGDRWHLQELTVHSKGNMQIVLEGMIGEDFRSDVALDDLSIEKGYCPGDMPPTPSTSTPTPGTPTPSPGSGTCVVEGDPHYHTFDNQIHHFMGTCTYTLSKLCESNSSLPYFNVEAANEHRGGNTRVSYVQYVDVDVYGQRIRLGKGGVVTVNGVAEVLPCTPSAGVQVSSSGFYTVVTTDFGLRVKFDGNHLVEVTLPSTFGQKVCGMCGNYNGMAADDFLNPDGVLEPDSTSLGNSWQVSNDSSCSAGQPAPPACSEADKQVIASSRFCGLLTDSSSPFEVCHAVLSPSDYFNTCLYDLCELGLDDKALCNSLQAYADACQALGVKLPAWRNATFCPITCPANSHYEPCAAACPATCVDPMAPVTCSLPCVEGCVCDSGYLLYNDRCVPSQQCGCWHNGQHYPVGSEFWTDNSCSTKCTCPTRGGKVQCSSASCPAGQYCGVQNGKPECLEHTYGICNVHGDPHYVTFDKVTHDFMGNCTYTLAKVCSNSSVPYFNVEAKNEHRGNPRVSYVREVLVEVYGERIAIVKQERSQVLVNGVRRTLPVSAAGGAIRVSTSGRYIVLETDFNLRVSYDADHSVEVRVPTTYSNLTCGMCGNFNSRREDDYMMPDGQQATDSNAFGESWKVPDGDPSCGVPPPLEPCSAEEEKLYQSEQFCGILTASPGFFESCHAVINPQSYFDTCSYDLCALSGSQEVLCGALEAYADACQAAGVTLLPWRNATFCPLRCPANSYYDPCMTGCPATCVDQQAPQNCSKPCMEGCACTSGFLLSGDACVPEANCGCLFEGNYYSEGEHLVNENCTRQCQCEANGQMVCSELSCGEEEICKIQDGQPGCYPASTALCHIYGDPHYSTFDGKLHHFQGSCNYTVVTACDNSSLGFSITTRNEHRGSPSWTALNSVALSVEGLHIALRKNKAVYINGALASLPASPAPGVTISLSGSYVQVSTKLGLQVQFNGDHELLVRVSEKHQGKLCGLCGTYTGRQEDDFTRPDGVVVPDTNAFGDSWRVPDDEWPCGPTTETPPSCSPSAEEAANKECAILTQPGGPFQPCHAVLPPETYFESCVYDHCATNGSTEQLCNALGAYAAACAEAGVAVGDWSAGTVCGSTVPPTSTPLPGTTTQPPHTTSPATSTGPLPPTALTPLPDSTTQPTHTLPPTTPVPSSGTCVVEGDPHYHTFDNQIHHFMGTCTYTLSKLCESNSSLPYFNVEAANEHRGGNTRVSYVQYVDVDVYGQRIRLGKGGVVTVNGVAEVLPCTPSAGVQVSSSGFYTVVTTDFGLRVKFDGNHLVEVTLPSTFGQKVCGMCGNYNGMAADDFLNPDGVLEPDSTSLGNSWQVSNDSSCSAGQPAPPACSEADKQVIASSRFCGLLTDSSSPFEVCHAVLSPSDYFNTCLYDLCELGLDDKALCNSLQAYADACQALGVKLPAWRNATFCPITCPANSHYEPCAAACPATCVDPLAPYKCSLPCVEGCVCDSGYLLYNDRCVPSQQCGCWHNGQHYPVGSEFWTDNSCSTKCTCPTRGGKVQCSSASCPAGQYCGVQNGKPECLDHTYGICNVHGDPHYVTFDKVTHDFMGNCTYTLAKVCSNSSVPYFNVEAKNEHRGNPRVSYVREVLVEVYGERIAIVKQERSQVLVNGVRRTLPVSAAGGAIRVSTSGRYIVLETDFNLRVSYDADHSVEVRVPTTYSNLTCGMCGNFNSRREDDYMMPDGQQAADSNALGESWKVPDGDPSCGVPPPLEPCSAEEEKLYQSEQFCGILTASPGFFESCHAVINPQSYFDTCSYDLCALSGSQEVLCGALEAYADACQAAGVTLLPWRNATFCPLRCPANSYYDPCMTGCPATCVDQQAPQNCSKPCMEGCACTSGFLLSGDACVPEANCGCLFEGNYYSEGEHLVNENCTRQCQCEANGQMVCSELSCGEEEICKIQDGQPGCYPASTALCHIYGDPHYSTFDGKLHHFQGSCNYTVVTACDNSSLGFSITTRNEHRGSPSWTALNSVALSVEGLHIALRKNKAVYINGALASLPASPAPGVTISLSGSYVQVSTKLGLQVQFNGDHELLVRVSEKHQGKLCGLCGTYTGRQEDDFTRPDGVVVPDTNAFGDSWRVPDDEWPCGPTTETPPSCSPSAEEAANKECAILTQPGGPFQPCHAVLPPETYFESCVYDHCATNGSTEQLCNALGAYAAACAEAGVAVGDWSAGTVCALPTACNFNCTFDVDLCEWVQEASSSIDWTRHKGPTPSPDTGPSFDHTTGDGYYIYLHGSSYYEYLVSQLVSPVCNSTGPHCFRFWYHMYGVAEEMALRVYVSRDKELLQVWEATGNHGDRWHLGEVTVHSTGNMQIVLEGQWGEDFRSDVALDDLSIEKGYCPGDMPPTPSTSTPTPGTPTPSPGSGTCVVEGDPHYHTFDNQIHHFMGTCTYTLSKLCESNSSLPYFNVEAANEHRGGNTRVSYVQYVDVDVYGQRIRLGKGGVVTVNGVAEVLPCTPSAGVQVSSSGFYTVVTTDFGLRVKFDGNHLVEVTLPSTFGQKVCGMCGNYNGMAADDFLNPDGVLEPDSTSLGNSWQVSNDSSCSAGQPAPPACSEADKQVIASSRFCGLLTDSSSPFEVCHAVLSPSDYFNTCLYDLCELGLDDKALCNSLQAYADACQALGVKLPAWRNATFCPITCPANSHYEPCAAACPATCVDPMAPVTCSLPCVEGCVCDSGYLLYNDRCVPSQQCGCWHNGQHYPVGSEFWTDNSCSTKCTCPTRGGKVQCSSASCPAGQYCGVQNGKPECLDHTYGICHVHGDPHYVTFDKVTHDFMGNCTYTLAKVCSNSSVPYFNVEAKNEHRGNPRVSYVREVLVEVYGERIAIVKQERSQVLVNGVRRTLPVSAAGGAIRVSTSGRYIVLETDFNLRVSYDADHSVEVRVPTTYSNLTCGMCGNFNSRREDDYMMPDGQQATDSNALGESWKVPDSDPSCGVPSPPEPCSAEEEKLYQSEQFCGILTASPGFFESCHAVINPQSYFDTCSYDLCALSGSQEVLCGALEAYADACQAAGMTLLPWRNATFCPLRCPANSYYDPCMTGCPATCVDQQAPQNCSKPCMEGCACTSGFLLSGDACVPEANCGCLFEGNYYSEGEHLVNENCTRQCQCEANGQMVCSELSCGEEEICKIQDGQPGCYPASTALCHIYGDPHYSTFDGKLHHFQGSCNYTVVTACDNSSLGFSITTRNEHRGSPGWTALNSVALSVEGLHIALRKNKAVYINGALASLPASPAPGVTISLSGSYVQVSTKLGLQVQFNGDHELLVRVSEKHQGKLCGLCGTYTGRQEDDFTRPDGVVVPDTNAFGDSWRVPDDEWPCDTTPVTPPSCSPSAEEAANKECAILTQPGGPFQPCHAVLPPKTYFESCVYDHCATNGSTEQLCNALGAYAAACAEAGVALGDWSAGTVCGSTVPPTSTPLPGTTTQPPHTTSPATSTGMFNSSCNFNCTFDVDLCEWVQEASSSIDWTRHKGPTPSPDTGPSFDHTTGDGYYIYLHGSSYYEYLVSQLVSPVCNSTGPHCFRFWYHMYGVAEEMALRVYVSRDKELLQVWEATGNHGDRWHLGEVTVHSTGNMQIVLEGQWGEDFRSDVALDDLSIEKGYCPGDMPPTPSTSTPTPGTPTPSPGSGTCVVEGDPHYHTFDNQIHHFMGTCTYTLSKLCESNSSLPYFNVEAANEHRGGNTRVSYVQYVDVDVYGQRIRLGKGGVVTVNGVAEVLPCTPSAGVQVSSSGFYTVVTTDFGLRVKFDGNHLVEVTLPSTFGQKVCGMCGNYNGMAADDFLNPDGVLEPDSTSLGNSWQVSNDSSCSAGQPAPPACSEADKQVIASSRFCGLLTDSSSPFEVCHAVLSPSDYFNTCLYDLCELGLDDKALCNSLQAYADACQALGVKLPAWRNATFCPITCPANSHYEPCAAACPATCVDPMAPVTCSLPCVEGCVCDSGYLLYNDRCVPSQQCGCWHNGQHYPVGSEFWTDNSCSTKCTCPTRGGKVQCSSASCPAGQYCGVQNGKPECLDHTYGICHVHGDPHYVTFDKVTHDFMGNCTYTLAKVCSNSSVPYFNVEAKNEHRGNPRVSYVREVLVEVYGERIAIVKQERSQVLVNGVRRTLPVSAAGGAIRVSTSGRYIVLETDFNLRVSYDADHSVEVRVPTTYSNLTCGMCGNFNSRREDDYMMPDGQQATDSNALGESWKVPDSDPSCGVPSPPEPCSAEEEKLYQSEQFCGILTASPGFFESCHAVINPQSYFDTCSYDLCALSGSQEVLCGALEAYADACQAAGVTLLPWRNATFCPLRCPANSYYDPCMTGCPATCVDQQAPQNCSKPCMEGCACTSGFLLSGDACVPEANCGCLFEGNYYSEGEHLVNENCTRQCQCEANGQMVCSELSCGEEEICKIQDGQPGCYPASTALCHIYGDPHYSTFDGKLHHFQGSCNYTVVTACDNSSLGFSITTRNEHRGSPGWTALNSVALSVEGLHIALRKNKAVYINGALASLPASPAPGVTISLSGSYVQVSTKLGLQVQFNGDHELLVRVSEKHQGKLCGLCGTYTGRQEDDFTRPDGVVVPDTNAFGDSWRVPDDEWPCDTTPVTPPSCSPSAEEAANKECAILTQPGGPFQPCHAVLPPKTYFESCVYDHCATNGSTEQLCNALGAYAAACAEAGVALGDWSAGTVCGSTVPPTSTPLPGTTTQPPHTTSPATSTDPTALPNVTTQPPWTTKPGVSTVAPSTSQPGTSLPVTTTQPAHTPSPPRPTPSSGHASCSASGDPHYNTFDHRVLHFMGNCTYTLSKVCNISQRIPYFDVSTTNEHRGANTKVSYVKSVQVEVYGNQISMLKNKKVNVNGRRMNLPIFIERKISIQSSGGYVLLETDFGLWVRYDGNHYAEVSVPSDYSGLLCGLCGNYNGDPTDDNIKPNGDIASNSNELGESWLVPENNTICSSGIEEECNADLENDAKKNTACGMITDPTGLFKDCHTKVPPENFFESCVYDMCFTGGQETSLCYGLQAYAESCNNAGICIEWRNTTLCPMSCPGGSIYQSCGTRCPSTCVSNSTATSCSLLPVEGCFCKEGYILSGDTCVPESSCGCVDEENQYHQLGESWFTSYSCNERCTCNAKNKIVCSPWECGVREECSVKDGVLGCHSNGQATCQVAGDPHYFTFDGLMYTFVGTCTYTLVEVISESVENITILGKNEDRGLRGATYLKEVYIDLYGVRITLQKSKGILLNNERVYTPVENRLRGVSIGNVGKYIVVETDFGVVVKYDGDHYLEITLPQSYFSKVHGMCGNFNDNLEDDLSLPNGTIVSITQFGNSWKVEKDSDAGCLPDSREDDVPPCTAENKPVIESQCNVLNSDKFKECHSLVKPEDFIKICIHDMCQYNGMKSTLCDIVQFYVDTCRNQGITIIWRNNTFCPLPCPTHSHYTNCASSCPSTCNDIFASSLCEKTEECTEGCECDNNYVLSNGNCVPLSNCGCRDDDNNYYSAGETWITAHCAKRCKCQQNGVIQCTSYSCDSEETCVIKSGKYKCNPTGFGTCRIMGDPHYVTFDGLVHHFQGKYTYIVAQTIPDLHYTLTPFSIEGMNYPLRRNSRITYLKEILINVYNHKVRFREGKQILLDGVRVRPPLRPHEGIRIYQRTKRIYLETDFGLYVSFDGNQNADIRLANTYKDKVEGLCGDFDGRSRNDFASPNGVLQKNVNIFGESWKVPLNRKTSRLRRDVSPTDESEVAQDTGLFQGCSENQLTQENSTSECQILTQSNGPFAKCHSEVSPDFYYMSCIFDMCVDRDDTTTLCRSLEEYVLACQEKGVNMEGWRQETACEMPCPANSKYSSCMSACPASCSDLTSPSECEWPCVEGCECLPGYVLSGFECVPYSQCGCSYLNKYYEIGEIFITDDCSQRCQCTESSTVSCTTIGCGSDEICNVSNYTRGCYKSGPCMPTPCQNDGVCSEITNGTSRSFYCECSELYTGQTCEVERREQTSPSGTPENHTVAIAVGVSAGVIVVLILISSAVYLHRRKRKMSIGAKRRDSSFNRSRDTTDNNVYEQDYGCIVNTAFDQDESAHDTNL